MCIYIYTYNTYDVCVCPLSLKMGYAPKWSQHDRINLNRETETEPKNCQINPNHKNPRPVLRGSHQPWLLLAMFGRVKWLSWNLRVQWLRFPVLGLKWLAETFLQTACCNVMQCLEGIKAIAPGSKLRQALRTQIHSFLPKGTSRWEQHQAWTVRVEPRPEALDHDHEIQISRSISEKSQGVGMS